jgi:hypothetical protein
MSGSFATLRIGTVVGYSSLFNLYRHSELGSKQGRVLIIEQVFSRCLSYSSPFQGEEYRVRMHILHHLSTYQTTV